MTAFVPFSEDVVFEAGPFSAAFSVSGDKFTSELERRRNNFDLKFEEKFGLEARVSAWASNGWREVGLVQR